MNSKDRPACRVSGTGRRFIEETFPVKEVSLESAREKNIRHGHISTLHIWWARRPLASSRATNYAALIPAPKNTDLSAVPNTAQVDEWHKQRNFIIEFSKWENSLNERMIKKAREEILKANGGKPPKVLDPFGGGGAIPLEALRLGCEVYSNDYNPVAVLIQKCTLEYPQKYGKPVKKKVKDPNSLFDSEIEVNPLLEDVKKWGNWVLEEAKKEIAKFYPEDKDGSTPVGYIWARTIPCQNPNCGAEIPLMRQFWLAKKANKKVALYPSVEGKEVKFKFVGTGYEKMPSGFKPENGTISRAVVICPVCGAMMEANTTRRLFQEGKSGERLITVVLHQPGQSGKKYRLAKEEDLEVFRQAEIYLKEKQEKLRNEWGMEPVPDGETPEGKGRGAERAFSVRNYGLNTWGELFNFRQKLALITFVEKVRQVYKKLIDKEYDEEYVKAVVSYLSCAISRLVDQSSVLVPWIAQLEAVAHTFNRQALGMVWDYVEPYPYAYYRNAIDWITRVIEHCSGVNVDIKQILHGSASNMPFPNNFFDAVFTDPPYYDNVPYSYLSDFFYVWLKRTLGEIYPELFSTPLSPKKTEIVAYSNGPGGWEDGKAFFENMLKKSFQEIQRVLKPNGVAIIVYAHKSTSGWETLINSLLDSGLVMTGAWPINTEMQARLRANESAALASSIYIVARKMERQPTGFYNDVKEELKKYLNLKLERLWQEGIGGADFFISAIGSAIEIFGKYEKVMDYEGNIVRADRLLEDVRKIATDYAVRQILHNGFVGEISDLTRFYVLFRWNYGAAKVHFDEARKLAQSCSIDLANEWNRRGFIKKQSEFIRILGPQDRRTEDINNPSELIDVLHKTLLLWEKGKRDEMIKVLKESGYGNSEAFYRVAQAVSETLPKEDKEKKLLDGFLAGRDRIRQEVSRDKTIGRIG